MITIGLIRENKKPSDKRVAFSPEQCLELAQRFPGLKILVESSPVRCIPDQAYRDAGFEVTNDMNECDVLFGIKEVPVEDLISGKTYLFFSHTIKKQPYNRKLLRKVLEAGIRLVDYETLVWNNGSRVLGFGRFAGIVGTHNAFLTWGRKSGDFELKPAYLCKDYEEMTSHYSRITLPPVRIALCGDGRVGHGCIELLRKLGVREVTPKEFLEETFHEAIYVHLVPEDFYRDKEGKEWDKSDFYQYPQNYESSFGPYTQKCDIMLNAIFWNERIPRFFSLADMRSEDFRIKVIADISCDINGSIPATVKDTTIEDPVFGFDPLTESVVEPYQTNTVDIMAVSNLPCELPLDASIAFGEQLLKHVVEHVISEGEDEMLRRATIADDGKLTPRFQYLSDYVA